MGTPSINKHNVGRIAERIVANELEFRGFRVSDLNKEGTSANSDLLAAKDGKTLQIQVKGATESPEDNGSWINYGHCNEAIIADRKQPMFNRCSGFYKADIVVLMSVKSPSEYSCIVLPWDRAEEAAQINLDRVYRTPKKDGQPKKPGPVWVDIVFNGYIPKIRDPRMMELYLAEQAILKSHNDLWAILDEQFFVVLRS